MSQQNAGLSTPNRVIIQQNTETFFKRVQKVNIVSVEKMLTSIAYSLMCYV